MSDELLDFTAMFKSEVAAASPPPASEKSTLFSSPSMPRHGHEDDLNDALRAIGFEAPLPLGKGDEQSIDTVLSCVSRLVQLRTTAARDSDRHITKISQLEKEVSRLKQAKSGVEKKLNSTEGSLARETSLNQVKSKDYQRALKKAAELHDQMTKKCTRLQHLDQGYHAQMRKQEQQHEKLQKQYARLMKLDSKAKDKTATMRMSSAAKKSARQAGAVGSNGNSAHSAVVLDVYERRQQELLAENGGLRETLEGLQKQFEKVLKAHQGSVRSLKASGRRNWKAGRVLQEDGGDDDGDDGGDDCDEEPQQQSQSEAGGWQMPYDWLKGQLEPELSSQMTALLTEIGELKDSSGHSNSSMSAKPESKAVMQPKMPTKAMAEAPDSGTIEQLKQQLEQANAVIKKQDGLIQMSLCAGARLCYETEAVSSPSGSSKTKGITTRHQRGDAPGKHHGGLAGIAGHLAACSPAVSDVDSECFDYETMDSERAELDQERRHLEKERMLFLRKAEDLDKQHLQLEITRHELLFPNSASATLAAAQQLNTEGSEHVVAVADAADSEGKSPVIANEERGSKLSFASPIAPAVAGNMECTGTPCTSSWADYSTPGRGLKTRTQVMPVGGGEQGGGSPADDDIDDDFDQMAEKDAVVEAENQQHQHQQDGDEQEEQVTASSNSSSSSSSSGGGISMARGVGRTASSRISLRDRQTASGARGKSSLSRSASSTMDPKNGAGSKSSTASTASKSSTASTGSTTSAGKPTSTKKSSGSTGSTSLEARRAKEMARAKAFAKKRDESRGAAASTNGPVKPWRQPSEKAKGGEADPKKGGEGQSARVSSAKSSRPSSALSPRKAKGGVNGEQAPLGDSGGPLGGPTPLMLPTDKENSNNGLPSPVSSPSGSKSPSSSPFKSPRKASACSAMSMMGGVGIDLPVPATPGTKALLEKTLLGKRQPSPKSPANAKSKLPGGRSGSLLRNAMTFG
jgi:hypothetical protein